jgi:hypothetical protein
MAIFQLRNESGFNDQLTLDEAMKVYNEISTEAFELMKKKNHDYGEAWREMRVSSLTDLILQKLLRVKQIEDNKGKTSGSRVAFVHLIYNENILIHKPHPGKILNRIYLKKIIHDLTLKQII